MLRERHHQRNAGDFPGRQRQGPLLAGGRVVWPAPAAPGQEAHRSQSEFIAQALTGGEPPPGNPWTAHPATRASNSPPPFPARKNKV